MAIPYILLQASEIFRERMECVKLDGEALYVSHYGPP